MTPYEEWIHGGAIKAVRTSRTKPSRVFFETLASELRARSRIVRAKGNRRFLEKAIGAALDAALRSAAKPGWDIRQCHQVALRGVPIGRKEVDAAILSKAGSYLIEQKTILRNNAFFEVAYEGWLLRRGHVGRTRFAGLFHHFLGSLAPAERLIADASAHGMLDKAYVLVRDERSIKSGTFAVYDPTVVDDLIADVRKFHGVRATHPRARHSNTRRRAVLRR